MPNLSSEQAESLDGPVIENEVRTAISAMKTGKSLDGFLAEYYKQHYPNLA